MGGKVKMQAGLDEDAEEAGEDSDGAREEARLWGASKRAYHGADDEVLPVTALMCSARVHTQTRSSPQPVPAQCRRVRWEGGRGIPGVGGGGGQRRGGVTTMKQRHAHAPRAAVWAQGTEQDK